MKIRALIILWLVALCALAMCGAGTPDIGLSGANRMQIGLRGGLGSGGNIGGQDTLAVIFTSQDVLDVSARPASIDTSQTVLAASPAAGDKSRRLVFTRRLARADSVHQLGLSDSAKVKAFAYACIDSTEPDGYANASGYQIGMVAATRLGAGPYTINRNYNSSSRRSEFIYIPFEKYIPAGATIDSAYICFSMATLAAATSADSVFANLLSVATDNKWYTQKRDTSINLNYTRAGWRRQIANNATGSPTWTATASDPWDPDLKTGRTKFNSWGATRDSTSLKAAIVTRTGRDISIKNCVQAIVAGATNNGIILNLGWKSDGTAAACNHAFWDERSDAVGRSAYVVIKYRKVDYYGALDTYRPAAPTSLTATGGNGSVSLSWTAPSDWSTLHYNVYRYFDGAPDTTLVGTAYGASFVDATAINGSPHNYFVSALDLSNNESYDSNHAAATPLGSVTIPYPAYYALWFQDPADATLSAARLDSLAAFDMVVTGPFPFELADESAYEGLVDSLRARNPDEIVLAYVHAWTPAVAWAIAPAGSAPRRMWDWLSANDGFALNTSGSSAVGDVYSTLFVDVDNPAIADTMANIWADVFQRSGINKEYSGVFIDDVVRAIPNSLCNAGNCGAYIDFDRDTSGFASDAQDQASFRAYHEKFIKAMRREFAQRGLSNRLIVVNSDFGNTATPAADETSLLARVDGKMTEGYHLWWPGDGQNEATWEAAFGLPDLLTGSQVSPPLALFQAKADSSAQFMSEPIAMACGGWISAQGSTAAGGYGGSRIPTMYRRLPNPGNFVSRDVVAAAGADTLVATYENYTLKCILGDAYASTYAIWAYRVFSQALGVLSLSSYW